MKISVVIAAYNEEKLVGKCLKAIMNQNYPKKDIEIIFVDNNSSDSTREVAKKLGVKPILYDEKQGAIFAKDYAANQATGEIVAVTDADAVPDKDWLTNIDKQMEDKNLQVVGGEVASLEKNAMANFLFNLSNEFAKLMNFIGVPLIWGSNMAFRKKAFQELKGFNTSLETGDDWEFVLRVQKKYGIKSANYNDSLKVKVSPRKQNNLRSFIPYFGIAIVNFVSVFILRKSYTFGKHTVVR